jgi:hypothetical protein
MKIKAQRNACENGQGEDHSCFIITEYCCDKAEEELNSDYIYRYLNDDSTICWGSFGEFLIDDVKFCPWCGSALTFTGN